LERESRRDDILRDAIARSVRRADVRRGGICRLKEKRRAYRNECLEIDDIRIGRRHRKQHGDLQVLADSIAVSGERRLLAYRDILGWSEILRAPSTCARSSKVSFTRTRFARSRPSELEES
jgi:hypothetical protein